MLDFLLSVLTFAGQTAPVRLSCYCTNSRGEVKVSRGEEKEVREGDKRWR
jgi:hypothetical protein